MNALTRWDPFKEMEGAQSCIARRQQKRDANFAQSRDIPEDRGERQMMAAHPRCALPNPTGRP
jgi:hypothetical protein